MSGPILSCEDIGEYRVSFTGITKVFIEPGDEDKFLIYYRESLEDFLEVFSDSKYIDTLVGTKKNIEHYNLIDLIFKNPSLVGLGNVKGYKEVRLLRGDTDEKDCNLIGKPDLVFLCGGIGIKNRIKIVHATSGRIEQLRKRRPNCQNQVRFFYWNWREIPELIEIRKKPGTNNIYRHNVIYSIGYPRQSL